MMKTYKVGVIGCGNISSIYLKNASLFPNYEIVAVADIVLEKAEERAEEYDIPKACLPDELLADDSIDLIINLTIPAVHAEIAIKAMQNGKHVYGEKPLAVELDEAQQMMKVAKEKNLYLCNAPDTFLGAGIQTSLKLINDGWIGKPVSATAFMLSPGHERWHPDPTFYYQKGGGPMFDMGPYYLTALIALLGPVARVTGSAQKTYEERTITSQPNYGKKIKVEVPTQINGVLDFESGAVGSIITTYDVWHNQLPFIEIYGTEGTISVPDPNSFGGPVKVRRWDHQEWSEIPLSHGFPDNIRGLGVAEMIKAIEAGEKSRTDASLAYHALEIMHGVHIASEENRHYQLSSRCTRPEPLPVGMNEKFFL